MNDTSRAQQNWRLYLETYRTGARRQSVLLDLAKSYEANKQDNEASRAYYKVKPAHRLAVAAVYLGLIALLVVGMDATHVASPRA